MAIPCQTPMDRSSKMIDAVALMVFGTLMLFLRRVSEGGVWAPDTDPSRKETLCPCHLHIFPHILSHSTTSCHAIPRHSLPLSRKTGEGAGHNAPDRPSTKENHPISQKPPKTTYKVPQINRLQKKIAQIPKNHLKPPTQCSRSTTYKQKWPNFPKTT
jgi:hypothetical protein